MVRLLVPLFDGVPVIVGHQNAPAPNSEYVVVWTIGSEVFATAEYDRSDQSIIEYDDTEYRIQFVGKNSALKLRRARALANFEEFGLSCHKESCAVMRWHDVQYTPMSEDNGRWSDRSTMDIMVRHRMVTRRTGVDPDSWIETADVTGRVNGKS